MPVEGRQSEPAVSVAGGGPGRNGSGVDGMDCQTLRDGGHRFNASGPDGLIDNWADGPTPRLSEEQLAKFVRIVRRTALRWRRLDLKRVIAERFGVDFHLCCVAKILHKLGFSYMSPRPRHPSQDERIVEEFKKIHRARCRLISMGCRRRRRSRYGSRMRPGSARRTGRFDSGASADRDLASLPTSAMNRAGFSGGSNFRVEWSHDEQDNEQIQSRGSCPSGADGPGSRGGNTRPDGRRRRRLPERSAAGPREIQRGAVGIGP
jgi:transposase